MVKEQRVSEYGPKYGFIVYSTFSCMVDSLYCTQYMCRAKQWTYQLFMLLGMMVTVCVCVCVCV